jgi:hypothetical protein
MIFDPLGVWVLVLASLNVKKKGANAPSSPKQQQMWLLNFMRSDLMDQRCTMATLSPFPRS